MANSTVVRTHNNNHLCPYCLIGTKQNIKCGNCGQPTVGISYICRIPKKDDKKGWQAFFKFFPRILALMPKSKRLKDMGIRE